jgi:hypothetical protein
MLRGYETTSFTYNYYNIQLWVEISVSIKAELEVHT